MTDAMIDAGRKAMADMEASIISVQLVLADRFTPTVREVTYKLGRLALAVYLAMPWYRRLWFDIRSGRAVRQVLDGLASLRPHG